MAIARMPRRSFVNLLVVGALIWPVTPGRADGTVSGRNSAAASRAEQSPLPNWPMDPLNDALLTVTIERGKARRMLLVQGSLGYTGTDAFVLGVAPTVNGRSVEPSARSLGYCTAGPCDTTAGSWWLDMDAAEAAHPGVFVGQPLVVRLLGGEISAALPSNGEWNAALTVQMVKK